MAQYHAARSQLASAYRRAGIEAGQVVATAAPPTFPCARAEAALVGAPALAVPCSTPLTRGWMLATVRYI